MLTLKLTEEVLLALRDFASEHSEAELYNDCNAALGQELGEDGCYHDGAPDAEALATCAQQLQDILKRLTILANKVGDRTHAQLGLRALGRKPEDADPAAIVEMLSFNPNDVVSGRRDRGVS